MEQDLKAEGAAKVGEWADGGQGRQTGSGLGPGGASICPNCGTKLPHEIGEPCFDQTCPKCGAAMTRE